MLNPYVVYTYSKRPGAAGRNSIRGNDL